RPSPSTSTSRALSPSSDRGSRPGFSARAWTSRSSTRVPRRSGSSSGSRRAPSSREAQRHRREAEQEDREADQRDEQAPAVERLIVVLDRRMGDSDEERREEAEERPRRPSERGRDRAQQNGVGNPRLPPAGGGPQDVSAVELSDRQQVERGDE